MPRPAAAPLGWDNAGMSEFAVTPDDPTAPDVVALLDEHLAFSHEHTPPGHVHALDHGGLQSPDISFFSIREQGRLLGVGALRRLDPDHAEIKSMHTAVAARGRGVARAMVEHLVASARRSGATRVSLETGTMDAFEPARRLYASMGFVECEPFGDYLPVPNSVCMTLRFSAG